MQEKTSNARGIPGGGCLSFDLTDTLYLEGLLHEIGLIYITNKLHHRKCFVRILFTPCKTLDAHSFVSEVLRLVNKNPYGALTKRGDSIRRNGGMAEHTEYSKIRNTRNILKYGIHGIF